MEFFAILSQVFVDRFCYLLYMLDIVTAMAAMVGSASMAKMLRNRNTSECCLITTASEQPAVSPGYEGRWSADLCISTTYRLNSSHLEHRHCRCNTLLLDDAIICLILVLLIIAPNVHRSAV